jgi:hypothetical protein
MNLLEETPDTRPVEPCCCDDAITLDIDVQNMDAVVDVVITLSRVGANLVSLQADSGRVRVTFHATEFISRRLPSLLKALVPVLDVTRIEDQFLDRSGSRQDFRF